MSVPIEVMGAIGKVLIKHGVEYIGGDELNALIQALTPCFEPGYQERVKKGRGDDD
jgi:hypothetical protein